MTDEINSLKLLVQYADENLSKKASELFYKKWKHETLVMQVDILPCFIPEKDTLNSLELVQTS